VAIEPPKHLHVRREQCYNLTPLLKQGVNNLELQLSPKPDKPRDEPDEDFCIAVVLTRPRSVASIMARIRTRSAETVDSGKQRVARLLSQLSTPDMHQSEDDCVATGDFGRRLRPLCPISHCPIEEAAIGRNCSHIQVFDLQTYIAVNQRMRSLDKRWTCPVCSLSLRPDDAVLEPFVQEILEGMRGEETDIDAVVFNDDCSWTTISAQREDKDAKQGDDEGRPEGAQGNEAVRIDLSDSE
jgi:hypothetical protein